ncbi:uncharacterized protein FFNC_15392 [Fusarium fujikuroi]|nr:uncharacterized protein FFNC_15392 [Fusarium fujikuroi]
MVWVQVDRRENGYSTSIYDAVSKASEFWDFDGQREAIEVIKREIKNGAKLDEDFPATAPRLFHKSSPNVMRDLQDASVVNINCYLHVRNLFLLGLCCNDKTISEALLCSRLPRSIQTLKVPLCVLVSGASEISADTGIYHFQTTTRTHPLIEDSTGQVEEMTSTPWSSENHQLPEVKLLWTDIDIANLLTKSSADTSGGYTNSGTTVHDSILRWATQQTLVLHRFPSIEEDGNVLRPEESGIDYVTSPDIPLTTLSILLCDSCGVGCVIGWFDWRIKDGGLTKGTVPSEWSMDLATCLECMEANTDNKGFDEFHIQNMVDKWLGSFSQGPCVFTEPALEGKALFLWCESHFQLLSMSLLEGLEPLKKEKFPKEIPFFHQWFREGEKRICIEISSPYKEGLPDY